MLILDFLLYFLLFYLVSIAPFYAIQWAPIYIMAKRYGYLKPWLVFVPIINNVVMHDIGLGKNKRKSFIFWNVITICLYVVYMLYFITVFFSNSSNIIHIIAFLMLMFALFYRILYKMYFTYKFVFKITNIKLISILGCIPILNILIFWYIVVKDNVR